MTNQMIPAPKLHSKLQRMTQHHLNQILLQNFLHLETNSTLRNSGRRYSVVFQEKNALLSLTLVSKEKRLKMNRRMHNIRDNNYFSFFRLKMLLLIKLDNDAKFDNQSKRCFFFLEMLLRSIWLMLQNSPIQIKKRFSSKIVFLFQIFFHEFLIRESFVVFFFQINKWLKDLGERLKHS